MKRKSLPYNILWVFAFSCMNANAQDMRTQYPKMLSNSFVGMSVGYINYPFSKAQLEPGYTVGTIQVPHTAVRIVLFGHEFNKYLAAQVTYMRPVDWVLYKNINGDQSNHSVWMNIVALTLTTRIPLSTKFSIGAEGGLAIITRKGFKINQVDVVKSANYATLIAGGNIQYHLSKRWDLFLNSEWSPAHERVKQPHTVFYSGGFNFYMRPLSAKKVEDNKNSGYLFPKQLLQAGYTSNVLGYGVNDFVSKGAIPIFWGGEARVAHGITVNYQRNIFHTRKVFSFDVGTGISYWQSKEQKDNFFTISAYPVFRFTAIRSTNTDLYFNYSVAGPTFISRTLIENKMTGKHFTFQDFMGMGVYLGKKKNVNAELRIAHYSNGNIFTENDGVKIPLTLNLGFAFD